MKAVILINPYLTQESEFYQPERLRTELAALGVSSDIVPNVGLVQVGKEICETLTATYDFCIYLDKDKYTPRALEAQGMRLFNRALAVETCDDKLLTHLALQGLPMPETIPAPLCYKEGAVTDARFVGERLGYPVVVKECFGSFGQQVYLANDEGELCALSQSLRLRPHLYQKFIAESVGRDLRVIAVGGEAVACMERVSKSGFRSNIACGGEGKPFTADGEVRSLVKAVTERIGLDYCGVDLLFGKDGYLICEVNSNAFFGGIEKVTGVNVARAYAEYMVAERRKNS